MLKKILGRIDELFLSALLAIMCIILILQVVFRYVFNTPLIWSEELARYIFIWMTMLGLSYNVRANNNISMELVAKHFPQIVRDILNIVINLIAMGVFIYLIPSSFTYLSTQIGMKSAALNISMGVLAASVPVGFILAAIQHAIKAVTDIINFTRAQRRQ